MKKKVVTVALAMVVVFCGRLVYGQAERNETTRWRLGVQLEVNWTNLQFSNDCHKAGEAFGVVFDERYSQNFSVAAITEIMLRRNLAFETGVEYASKGWNSATTVTDLESGIRTDSRETVRLRYLQVPFLLGVRRERVFIRAGGYWGYALSGRETSNQPGVEPFRIDFGSSRDDFYSGTDYGIRAIVGYELTANTAVVAQVQYGLANQIPSESAAASRATGRSTVAHHRSVGIGVRYLF